MLACCYCALLLSRCFLQPQYGGALCLCGVWYTLCNPISCVRTSQYAWYASRLAVHVAVLWMNCLATIIFKTVFLCYCLKSDLKKALGDLSSAAVAAATATSTAAAQLSTHQQQTQQRPPITPLSHQAATQRLRDAEQSLQAAVQSAVQAAVQQQRQVEGLELQLVRVRAEVAQAHTAKAAADLQMRDGREQLAAVQQEKEKLQSELRLVRKK